MKKSLNIGAYLRVSTDKQVQIFEGSLDTQKYRMNEFVNNKNKEQKQWGQIVEFYVEEGYSAGTDKRPAYRKMMADVASGKINLILVADISRLSRNNYDFGLLLKTLESYNASYLSMKEQFDTTTPSGRLMINMVVSMAQFEREQTSERVSINCNSRAMRGYVSGGRVPLGYEVNPEKKGTYFINESEACDVNKIFEIFKQQGSVLKALPLVNAVGIKPKYAKDQENGTPSLWSYNQLRNVLTNEAYVGIKVINKKNKSEDPDHLKPWELYQKSKASWPAIVDEKLFYEVQEIISENAKIERRRMSHAESRAFLLTGLLVCGHCHKPLSGQSAHGNVSVHRYYGHSTRFKGHKCVLRNISADEIEDQVIRYITEITGRAGYFENLKEKLDQQVKGRPDRVKSELLQARDSLKKLELEIKQIFKLQTTSANNPQALELVSEQLEKLGSNKRLLVQRISNLETLGLSVVETQDMVEELKLIVKDFKKGFANSSPSLQRRFVRKIFSKLVLTDAGTEIHFNFRKGAHEFLNQQFSDQKMGKLFHLDNKRSPPIFSGDSESDSDLILAFSGSSVCEIGWGRRT